MLQLSDEQARLLKSAGASNLAGIAAVLHAAPEVELHNAEVKRIRSLFKDRGVEGGPPDPIKFPVAPQDVAAIIGAIGTGLAGGDAHLKGY
jgi:hypothetical protein